MPPPSDHASFRLSLLEKPFYVKQLQPHEDIPDSFLEELRNQTGHFVSITRTDEEVSIVGEAQQDDTEATWRCIKIAGPMDFGVTGVMANFTAPLKTASVPVFAVSTWNTDYILLPREKVKEARDFIVTYLNTAAVNGLVTAQNTLCRTSTFLQDIFEGSVTKGWFLSFLRENMVPT
ncbi:unnamed protein product [Somion occarium]|uniref:CASTOR ACT domain-containing protein n=1 Tax=Somion occarium TaxID=3059160 RepID=A0ABP1CFP5_9APHY